MCLFVALLPKSGMPEQKPIQVTLWFDDGWTSTYEIAYPIMKEHGWVGVMSWVVNPNPEQFEVEGQGLMALEQAQEMYQSGWEISNHTMTHPRGLNTLSTSDYHMEVVVSQWALQGMFGSDVTTFTAPFGEGRPGGFTFVRTMEGGINYPSESVLKAQFMKKDTTEKVVLSWVQQAKDEDGWLIIGLHAISENPNEWQITEGQFEMLLEVLHRENIRVVIPKEMMLWTN